MQSAVLAIVNSSVCLSVCPSVMRRYCEKNDSCNRNGSVDLVNAFIREWLRSDSSVPAAHRPELVTIGLIVHQ